MFQRLTAALELLTHDRLQSQSGATSPSTGRRAYPSTAGEYANGTGVAWQSGEVDTTMVDDTPLPAPATPWSRADLARAVAANRADAPEQVPLVGVSRRPGSLLNRFTRHLADDLLSQWRIEPASRRGTPGHDLEVIARLPSGARKHLDRAHLSSGWSRSRRPSSSEATLVVHPHHDPAATAMLVAATVADFCEAIGWPLPQWRLPA